MIPRDFGTSITICVAGNPVAQGRGRASPFRRNDGKLGVRVYDPEKSRAWKSRVYDEAVSMMTCWPLLQGPVEITVVCRFVLPAGWPPWKVQAWKNGLIAHTSRPDADNLLKGVKDALKGVVWRDDSQVVRASVEKQYHEKPGALIVVTTLPMAPGNIASKKALAEWFK